MPITSRLPSLLAAMGLLLSGCAHPTAGGFASAQPSTDPARPTTPFTSALGCLDTMLRTQPNVFRQVPNATNYQALTVGLIPDATGRINPGLRDMVSGAAFTATNRSQRFILVEAAMVAGPGGMAPGVAASGMGLVLGPSGGGSAQVMPNANYVRQSVQIKGSLTQADKGIEQNNVSLGGSVSNNTISAGSNFDFGAVVLSLQLVEVATGRILQSTNNGLVVRNDGKSINADLKIGSFGVSFQYSSSTAEGPHQAVSTLVDLSVAELLGREAGVPYWQCLSIDRDNPALRAQARDWYDGMSDAERDSYVRQRLSTLGYRVPEAPAAMTEALLAFQSNNDLIPLGRITYDTFAALAAGARPGDSPNGKAPAQMPPPNPVAPRNVAIAVRESVADQTLWLQVTPDRAGFVSCYYHDEHGRTVRLYPNRTQPAVFVRADIPLAIPPFNNGAPFDIKPDHMTADLGFLCLATGRDVSAELPVSVQADGFQEVGAGDFASIIDAYRKVAGNDLAVRATTRGRPDGSWNRM